MQAWYDEEKQCANTRKGNRESRTENGRWKQRVSDVRERTRARESLIRGRAWRDKLIVLSVQNGRCLHPPRLVLTIIGRPFRSTTSTSVYFVNCANTSPDRSIVSFVRVLKIATACNATDRTTRGSCPRFFGNTCMYICPGLPHFNRWLRCFRFRV